LGDETSAPHLQTKYVLTEEGGREQPTAQEGPVFNTAAPPNPIDYDDIYHHIERRLGESVVGSREGV
jgi:hypothetical protein